jgi:N4-gp56 family major capsid protein
MATTQIIHTDDQTLLAEADVFIPEIWTDAIRASFNKKLVLGDLASDYSALVSGGGDKIHIPTYQDVADAQQKSQGVPINFATNTEVEHSITIDQHYATAVMIDDMAKIQSSYDLTSGIAESMGYKLGLHVEKALFTKLATSLNAVQLDNGDDSVDRVLNKARIAHIMRYVYSQNLNPDECVMVLSNRLFASLFTLDDFIHISKTGAANLPTGAVGTIMGMPVIQSPEVGNDTIHADTTAEDGSALADTRRPGGYVLHRSALGIAYSKQPTPVAEYDMEYIAHKMVTDMVYGCALLQDTNQVKAISLVENDQDTAAAWQS